MASVVFFNQAGGRLFKEFVFEVSHVVNDVKYYTSGEYQDEGNVQYVKLPRHIKGKGLLKLLGWFWCLIIAAWKILRGDPRSLLFIVSIPPISPLLGLIAKKLRGNRYILLFYDIYPEALIRFAGLSEKSIIARAWRSLNKYAIRNADRTITISRLLWETLNGHCSDPKLSEKFEIDIIPTWVDTDHIRPIFKEENEFARIHHQVDKLTVLYAGNTGFVHDLRILPEVASRLKVYSDIHFMVVGDGVGRKMIEKEIIRKELNNMTLLPFQNEEALPYLLATGDIAIISLAAGAEYISMPSKTYYGMAAGSALLGFSVRGSDLSTLISQYDCGYNVDPKDVDGAVKALLKLRNNPKLMKQCRDNSRQTAVKHYSRSHCVPKMVKLVSELLNKGDVVEPANGSV